MKTSRGKEARTRVFALVLVLAVGAAGSPLAGLQSSRDAGCTDWRDCRQLALAAADRGDYEAFHDLAWRAIQTGPPRDPALMYLLARAQSLSGRPHDALVMLQRLADMGIPSDAATNEDFSRTRQLPAWPDLQARMERSGGANSPPAVGGPAAPAAAPVASATAIPAPSRPPARTVTPSAAPSSLSSTPASTAPPKAASPVAADEALRFSTARFAVAGLAHDSVSGRYLLGDRLGQKVMVVGEGSNHASDLVSGESAGFREVSAIEIDAKRGDLWVASAAGSLHRLQLVSGRPLKAFTVATDLEPVSLVDLAVGPAGGVFALDSVGPQLLALRAGGTSLERVVRIEAQEPSSVAVGDDEGVAYVAHRDGVSRIDLRARTMTRLAAPAGIVLTGLERIRWYRQALIAVAAGIDGSRRIIRLELNPSGRAVTRAVILETPVAVADRTFAITGDELVYLVSAAGRDDDRPSTDPASGSSEFVAYRIRLR